MRLVASSARGDPPRRLMDEAYLAPYLVFMRCLLIASLWCCLPLAFAGCGDDSRKPADAGSSNSGSSNTGSSNPGHDAGERDAEAPVVDASPDDLLRPLRCSEDGDCKSHNGTTRCVGGLCKECKPSGTSSGCLEFSYGYQRPICIPEADGEPRCQHCTTDAQCAEAGLSPRCVGGQCAACDPLDRETDQCPSGACQQIFRGGGGPIVCGPCYAALCPSAVPVCRPMAEGTERAGDCVECDSNDDCKDPAKPACDLSSFTCGP